MALKKIEYRVNAPVSADEFIALLNSSGLSERRPVENRECMEGVVKNSNLIVTAWDTASDKEALVGIARSVTDFHYACYLSDLAVARTHQKMGVGKQLQTLTQNQLGSECKLILLAAPSANEYYAHIGFKNNPRCWVLNRDNDIQ